MQSVQLGGIDSMDIMETIIARISTEQDIKLNAVNDDTWQ